MIRPWPRCWRLCIWKARTLPLIRIMPSFWLWTPTGMARENFRGERSRPSGGSKGASPGCRPRRRRPEQARGGNGSDIEKQSAIDLRERNAAMRLKRQAAEIELARARDELIEKRLVTRQLAYVLIPFHQAVAAIPSKMRRQLGE